jgi:hypothetical protein
MNNIFYACIHYFEAYVWQVLNIKLCPKEKNTELSDSDGNHYLCN